jgi:hypothetical protein
MLNKEALRNAILSAVGNPESGVIVENLDAIVDAIEKKQKPEQEETKQAKHNDFETRVVKPSETRTTDTALVVK